MNKRGDGNYREGERGGGELKRLILSAENRQRRAPHYTLQQRSQVVLKSAKSDQLLARKIP